MFSRRKIFGAMGGLTTFLFGVKAKAEAANPTIELLQGVEDLEWYLTEKTGIANIRLLNDFDAVIYHCGDYVYKGRIASAVVMKTSDGRYLAVLVPFANYDSDPPNGEPFGDFADLALSSNFTAHNVV